MKVAIVDDHRLFRRSLNYLLVSFEGIEVVFEAENGKQLFEKLKKNKVDLVLLDIQMPEVDGFEACRHIRKEYPDVKVLIVSQLTTRESIHTVMELGAHGFFSKNADPENLRQAIFSIQDKGFYFDQELGSVLKEVMLAEKENNIVPIDVVISPRELEVIRLACKELSSIEIAEAMNINIRTVETHRKRLMEKTGSKNFLGVIFYALKHGHVSLVEV